MLSASISSPVYSPIADLRRTYRPVRVVPITDLDCGAAISGSFAYSIRAG